MYEDLTIKASGKFKFNKIFNVDHSRLRLNESGQIGLIVGTLQAPKERESLPDGWVHAPQRGLGQYRDLGASRLTSLDTENTRIIRTFEIPFVPNEINFEVNGQYIIARNYDLAEAKIIDVFSGEFVGSVDQEKVPYEAREVVSQACEEGVLWISNRIHRQSVLHRNLTIHPTDYTLIDPAFTQALQVFKVLRRGVPGPPSVSYSDSNDFTINSYRFKGTGSKLRCVRISSDRKFALSGHENGNAYLWEFQTSRCLARLKGHKGPVLGTCFSGDGKCALTAGQDKRVLFWRIPCYS